VADTFTVFIFCTSFGDMSFIISEVCGAGADTMTALKDSGIISSVSLISLNPVEDSLSTRLMEVLYTMLIFLDNCSQIEC